MEAGFITHTATAGVLTTVIEEMQARARSLGNHLDKSRKVAFCGFLE